MKWISIKDQQPEEDKLVLFQAKCNSQMYVGYKDYSGYKCIKPRGSSVTGLVPIAWMELPEKYNGK